MRRIFSLCISALLLLCTACSATPQATSTAPTLACTTYPVYLLAQAVTDNSGGFEPVLVIDQQISCLHDYTLTTRDMTLIENSDFIAINGADMEHFLEDVLENRAVIDCSEGLDLLWNEEEGEEDCHLWLSPVMAEGMIGNLAQGLSTADPDHAAQYQANADTACEQLERFYQERKGELDALPQRELITFHDGFEYFAQAFDLNIVAAVEEEEGSEASARRIVELAELIDTYHLTAVYTEQNGSTSAATALSMERPVKVYSLTLGMSRDSTPEGLSGLAAYEAIIQANVTTLLEAENLK